MHISKAIIALTITTLYSCNSKPDAVDAASDDSTINALNAADTISKIPQAIADSINRAYLDSFTKYIDTNNAEFGNHK